MFNCHQLIWYLNSHAGMLLGLIALVAEFGMLWISTRLSRDSTDRGKPWH